MGTSSTWADAEAGDVFVHPKHGRWIAHELDHDCWHVFLEDNPLRSGLVPRDFSFGPGAWSLEKKINPELPDGYF